MTIELWYRDPKLKLLGSREIPDSWVDVNGLPEIVICCVRPSEGFMSYFKLDTDKDFGTPGYWLIGANKVYGID